MIVEELLRFRAYWLSKEEDQYARIMMAMAVAAHDEDLDAALAAYKRFPPKGELALPHRAPNFVKWLKSHPAFSA